MSRRYIGAYYKWTGSTATMKSYYYASGGVWISLDVTALTQGWVATPAQNYGVVLKQKMASGFVSAGFCTENSWWPCDTPTWKPKLTITYTLPGGQMAQAEVKAEVEAEVEAQPQAPAATVITKYYSIGGQRVAMRKDGVLYYLLTDHLGSTSVVIDQNGGVVAQQRYKPFGEPRGPAGTLPTDRKFTGQRSEEAGLGSLYDYGARFYSPSIGRFLSPDSIIPQPGNPQSLNRYSYVLNSPLRFTDPTGHCATDENDVCDPVETRREHTRICVRSSPYYADARLALANMIYGEQGGETASFQVVAGYVAWNRAGHRLENVVLVVAAPNQFQGYQGPHIPVPEPTGRAKQAWDSIYNMVVPDVLTGVESDPTGGAIFFANIETEQAQVYADTLARQVQDKYPNENLSRDQALVRAGYGSLSPGRLSATGHPLVYNRLESVALQNYQVVSPQSPLNVSPGTGPTRGTPRHLEAQP